LLQTLKVTSASLWRDVHEIKFPLPPGGHVDVSNEFVIPLTMRVLKKTVQTCAHSPLLRLFFCASRMSV